ncbi:MAG TPA: acyl-CoA dehydrogenase, partial [Cellulomonas sp.]
MFAAEGPGVRLEATRHHPGDSDDRSTWTLTGTKPWCSLADRLDAALVTAHLPEGGRGLFAVALRQDGVRLVDQPWASRGLAEIPSTPVSFDAAPAVPVGAPGWYLDRPGFWWGGIGVAACWFGGAVAVARRVLEAATSRPDDVLLAMHLGALDERLEAARLVLADAATAVDGLGTAQSIDAAADASDGSGGPDGAVRDQAAPGQAAPDQAAPDQAVLDGPVLAKRVRATVARTCEDVLRIAGHALGPAPLALEPEHAKRVADLQVYVRQQHAER